MRLISMAPMASIVRLLAALVSVRMRLPLASRLQEPSWRRWFRISVHLLLSRPQSQRRHESLHSMQFARVLVPASTTGTGWKSQTFTKLIQSPRRRFSYDEVCSAHYSAILSRRTFPHCSPVSRTCLRISKTSPTRLLLWTLASLAPPPSYWPPQPW